MRDDLSWAPEHRKLPRFAWLPKKLRDGKWIWLKRYWISVPEYLMR